MWSTYYYLWGTDKYLWGTDKSQLTNLCGVLTYPCGVPGTCHIYGALTNPCGVLTNPFGVLTMSTRWLTMFWTHSSTVSLPAFSVTSGSSGDSYIWSTPVNPTMYRVLFTLQSLKLRDLSPTLSLHQTIYQFLSKNISLTFDFSSSGLLVEALDISFLTNLNGGVHKTLHKLQSRCFMELSSSLTILQK